MHRVAMFTLMNPQFLEPFKVFLTSFLENNPWFDCDFVVLNDGVPPDMQDLCKERYNRLRFEPIKRGNYKKVRFRKTAKVLQPTYFKLDTFSFPTYSRVVFLDLDMVILGDISGLFKSREGFGAVRGYDIGSDALRSTFNSGVFSVGRKFLSPYVYQKLLRLARPGYSMPDQSVLNSYFRGKTHFFPKEFNVEKRVFKSKKYRFNFRKDVKILHYVGPKPWHKNKPVFDQGYEEIEEIWHEWHKKSQ